jgi:hypothetical protein
MGLPWSTISGRRLIFEDQAHVLGIKLSKKTDKLPHASLDDLPDNEFIDLSQNYKSLAKRVLKAFAELKQIEKSTSQTLSALARKARLFTNRPSEVKARWHKAKIIDHADVVIVFRKQTQPVFGHHITPVNDSSFGQAVRAHTANKNQLVFSFANNLEGDVYKAYMNQIITTLENIRMDKGLAIHDIVINLNSSHVPQGLDPSRVRKINSTIMALYRNRHHYEIVIRVVD